MTPQRVVGLGGREASGEYSSARRQPGAASASSRMRSRPHGDLANAVAVSLKTTRRCVVEVEL
jgi:hypothetical protein